MKRFIVTIILILFASSFGFAQITMSHAAKPVEKEEPIAPFDSTRNFLGNTSVKSYIGQLLYVNGKSEGLREYGYSDFKTQKEPGATAGRYGSPADKSHYNTKYEDLFGKYFVVVDVQPDSRQSKSSHLYGDKWWFLLRNRDNEADTVWFEYSGQYETLFPFITTSYFNYLKEGVVGKKFYPGYSIKDDGTIKSGVTDHDFYSGESFSHSKSDIWECIDVTVEDQYYRLILIVKNQNGNVGTIQSTYLRPLSDGRVFMFTKEEYDRLCQKYGASYMDLVRQRLIRVGMPEELLIMSWGKPDKVNRSSHGSDQWVYGNQYVYVDNGKISSWN